VSAIPSAVPEDGPSRAPRPYEVADLPTLELLDAVIESGYTGHPWAELTRRLVTTAQPELERAIRTGAIYRRCRRAGYKIAVRQELQRWPLCEDIAAEAVEECLVHFKTTVLPEGEWDPGRGTSLEVFFAECCLPRLANRWRLHLRQLRAQAMDLQGFDESGPAGVLAVATAPPADPAHRAELRDELARAAAPLNRDDLFAFDLQTRGWSRAEIAQELGVKRNTLDARINRAQRAARARRTA
jgi:DNA-directed RNA polymerase specialized sigma24 family protein